MASDSLYQALNVLSGISLNIVRTAEQKEKLRHLERMQLQGQEWKENYQKTRDDYELRRNVLQDTKNQNIKQITNLGDEMAKYRGQADELVSLPEKFTTPEGEKTLEELGLEIGEDFQVRMNIENESADILNTMNNQIMIQRLIIDDLGLKQQKIEEIKVAFCHKQFRKEIINMLESKK